MKADQEMLARVSQLISWAGGQGGSGAGPAVAVRQVRDASVLDLLPGLMLVVTCDSDGSIGPKPHDLVQVTGYHIGRFGTRVALMELLATGARPFLVVDTLAVEMDPTGREIIAGVRDEVASAGLTGQAAVTGSTEDNVPTTMTGLGITALGLAVPERLRPGTARPHDEIICVGERKTGPEEEVRLEDPTLMDLPATLALLELPGVRDILPVGSHGIAYEANLMAQMAGLQVEFAPDAGVNLTRSAGPATCCLVSAEPGLLDAIRTATGKPCYKIGRLLPQ